MGTDKETEAAHDKAEATRQELEDLRQNLCKEFTARVPSTTDAAMHVLYLDKALQDIKEAYKDQLTWGLEDYRQFYEALQQSKVYRTESPQHWWAWSKWFQSQSKAAQVELLKQAGLFALQKGLLVAAIGGAFSVGHWVLGRSERKTQAIYQDWQVINSAQGKPGSGGRIQAIQDLYRQGEPLSGLSAPKGAYLVGLHLVRHEKQPWNPFDSERTADLSGADLSGADLSLAVLIGTRLFHAKLNGARILFADLSGANLSDANLSGANLSSIHLIGTDLSGADLSGADLSSANFSGAYLLATDLRNTKNFDPTPQLKGEEQPLLCNVALPEGFKDKDKLKDRDCDRLPQELLKRYPLGFESIEDAKNYVDEERQKKWK